MRDKRPVDELSIDELERILAIRKREARLARLHEYGQQGRVLPVEQGNAPEPIDIIEPEPLDDAMFEEQPYEAEIVTLPVDETLLPAPIDEAEDELVVEDIEDKPIKPEYFEGEPRFEDEAPRPKPRPTRQRIEARRHTAVVKKPDIALVKANMSVGTRNTTVPQPQAAPEPLSPRAALWNRFLSVVEIGAVIGLLALGYILFQSIQSIERRTAIEQASIQATALAAQIPPTPTPIINIPVRVLPGGHKYEGNAQGSFNFEEIPAQYREQYASLLAQLPETRPSQPPEGPTHIRINKIDVDSIVVYGDDWEALKQGVGQHIGTANPGQVGNMVLSAHNDIYGEIFRYLDKLEAGDEIVVSTVSQEYKYVVGSRNVVNPDDTWVLDPTNDRRLTLISCYPYRVDNKRIVVFATLVS
jgi:sortase A